MPFNHDHFWFGQVGRYKTSIGEHQTFDTFDTACELAIELGALFAYRQCILLHSYRGRLRRAGMPCLAD